MVSPSSSFYTRPLTEADVPASVVDKSGSANCCIDRQTDENNGRCDTGAGSASSWTQIDVNFQL